jgi:DNA-binding GntR family transcriptional regulator
MKNDTGPIPEFPKPPTLKEHLVQWLTDAIVAGQIKPGERLFEVRLAEKFRVSRAPVREALNKLVELGLAVSRPRHGIFVVKLEEEDLQKINSLRLILEAEALRLCRARLTPEGEAILERLIRKLESSGPLPAVKAMQLDLDFHRAIWHMTGNEYLENFLTSLTGPLFAQHVLLMPREEKARKVINSHRALFEFIQGKLDRPAEDIMLDLLSVRWSRPARFSSLEQSLVAQTAKLKPATREN